MNIQINDENDFTVIKGKDGHYVAFPNEANNMVAEGETEQEAVINLMKMCEEIARYEYRQRIFTQSLETAIDDFGIQGVAEHIMTAIERRPKDELTTGWYLHQIILYFKEHDAEIKAFI